MHHDIPLMSDELNIPRCTEHTLYGVVVYNPEVQTLEFVSNERLIFLERNMRNVKI